MILGNVPASQLPAWMTTVPNTAQAVGQGKGAFPTKTAASKQADKNAKAAKEAADKTATDQTPVGDKGDTSWLDSEVVIAGKAVKRKYLVGVAGASVLLILITGMMGGKK